MVNAGMPPAAALQAATLRAADLLDQSADLGTLEAGKFADIVAVTGNPVANIGLMEKIDFVMKNGKVYKHQVATGNTASD